MSSQINPVALVSSASRHLITTSQSLPDALVQSVRHGLVRPDDKARKTVAAWSRGMWIALMAWFGWPGDS